MNDLIELGGGTQPTPDPETYDAIVSEDASPGQPVYVVVPDFDPNLNHGPCPWIPIVSAAGIFYPHKGDKATIVEPANGTPRIVGWTPSTGTPDATFGAAGGGYLEMPFPATTTVTLAHNLGGRPSVAVIDSAGNEWQVQTKHLDENTVQWSVPHPFSGTAIFNLGAS